MEAIEITHKHTILNIDDLKGKKVVALVGSPNVGKSALFYKLTGKYAWISNYPGTTVDVSIGRLKGNNDEVLMIDTPGMYSLYALTEDEKVARRILFDLKPDCVVHVVEARNIERSLWMTFLLMLAGFKVILNLNAIDEAERFGLKIDFERLEKKLGIPVIPTIATKGVGVENLRRTILKIISEKQVKKFSLRLRGELENIISNIEALLKGNYPVSKRLISILLILGDEEIQKQVLEKEVENTNITETLKKLQTIRISLQQALELKLRDETIKMLEDIVSSIEKAGRRLSERISDLMINPISGSIILLFSLFLLYLFVGLLGAQIIVDFIEEEIFEGIINPIVNDFLIKYSPNQWIYELLGGEYGIITLGLRYAFAIILPIVSLFFIAFSIVEDSGYLPRLALLLDRLLKKIGLSGRAIIPLILGLGCDTMATVVTRTLETRKERVLATLMLALGIPCSAQLGVILGLLPDFKGLMVWLSVISTVLLIVAYIASKVIPGGRSYFIMELPPLRIPRPSNILMKTWTRLEWYLKEVIPLFIFASILIWIGRITGIFEIITSIISIPTTLIGLPKEASIAFLYGFFRRDYGAAGFYDLKLTGKLNAKQTLTSMVTITLFVPCIAQFSVMVKERGWKTAIIIILFIIPLAFTIGYIVHYLATVWGY